MRINIVIDDELMKAALKATGLKAKHEVVAEGLKLLVKRDESRSILELKGKIEWAADLDQMRSLK